ncbi:MAG: (2Fe-2S) ferredoxin domain-containing protein [Clostridia bacterium]|nr:(2Fe-2S) ferredoxin domain-containing protein [Clostridia bacterium]
MKVTVCIGSYCHLKGSRTVAERLRERIAAENLEDKIDLAGTFCMGNCRDDVSVSIGDEVFSVSPETVDSFFENEVLPRLNA